MQEFQVPVVEFLQQVLHLDQLNSTLGMESTQEEEQEHTHLGLQVHTLLGLLVHMHQEHMHLELVLVVGLDHLDYSLSLLLLNKDSLLHSCINTLLVLYFHSSFNIH